MARAAGNTSGYEFAMIDKNTGEPTDTRFEIPGVTSIIKGVLGSSFGSASWWGYKVAAAANLEIANLSHGAVLEEYERLKLSKITPNSVRDEGGTRGTRAHEVLELLYAGLSNRDCQDAIGKGWDGYCQSVCVWFNAWNHERHPFIHSELRLFSLRHLYAGTTDLVAVDLLPDDFIIADLKTHKPAGKKKPAYFEDLLQMSAYGTAYEERYPGKHHTGNLVIVALEDGSGCLEDRRWIDPSVFLAVRAVYDGMKEAS